LEGETPRWVKKRWQTNLC